MLKRYIPQFFFEMQSGTYLDSIELPICLWTNRWWTFVTDET